MKTVLPLSPFGFLKAYWSSPDFHPPGYYFLINMISQFLPLNELTLRIPSAIASAATTYAVAIAGAEWFSEEIGLTAAGFWMVSGAGIYYGQEARSYAFLTLFCTLLLTASYRLYKSHAGTFAPYLFLSFLTVYVHYMGFFFFLLLTLYFGILSAKSNQKSIFSRFMLAGCMICLVYLPWIYVLFSQAPHWHIDRAYNRHPNLLVYFFRMIKFGLSYEPYWTGLRFWLDPWMLDCVSGITFLTCIVSYLIRKKKQASVSLLTQIFLFSMPIFLFFLRDTFGESKTFVERNLIFLIPLLYLILAALLFYGFGSRVRNVLIIWILALMIFEPFLNLDYFHSIQKTEFRKVSESLSSQPEDTLFVSACGDPAYFEYYLNRGHGRLRKVWYLDGTFDFEKVKRFWLLSAECFPEKAMIESIRKTYHEVNVLSLRTSARAILLIRN